MTVRSVRSMGVVALAAALELIAAQAYADRKYFVETYTPYLAAEGKLEYETWLTSKSGKQEPDVRTAWDLRTEFEYGVTDHLTGAFYLNFAQEPGEGLRFEGPSLEFIYQLTEPGTRALDTALYLETTETGEELELEPKLLLARRVGRWITALNLISEFELRHNDAELTEEGDVLHNEWKPAFTIGVARELGEKASIGLESRWIAEYPNFKEKEASSLSLGPVFNLQSGRVQMAIGILPQLAGSPSTSGNLNLVEFERTQVRIILGIDL